MKLIYLIVLLTLSVHSDQRVPVKNQLKRSKTFKRVQKLSASTNQGFEFKSITESNQIQFMIGGFTSLAKELNLEDKQASNIFILQQENTRKCLKNWKTEFKESFKEIKEKSQLVKESFKGKEQPVSHNYSYDPYYYDLYGFYISDDYAEEEKKVLKKYDEYMRDLDLNNERKKSKLQRYKKIWFFSNREQLSQKADEEFKQIEDEDKKQEEQAKKIDQNPENENWKLELAKKLDDLIQNFQETWEKIEIVAECFKIVMDELVKLSGFTTNLWDYILSIFKKAIVFYTTTIFPYWYWIKKAYQCFHFVISAEKIHELIVKYPKWDPKDYRDFGEKIVDLMFQIKHFFTPFEERLSQKRRLIQKAQRRFRSGKQIYRYRNISSVRTKNLN